MAQTSSATANFNNMLRPLIAANLEELLRGGLPHLLPGNFIKATHVAGSTGTMRYTNIPDIAVDDAEVTASLVVTEGLPNAAAALAFGNEEFATRQRMKTLSFTDVSLLESPQRLLVVGAERLARYVLALGDRIAANKIGAGANVYFAGNAAGRAAFTPATVLTGADIRAAVARLDDANVPRFADGFYRCILDALVKLDFMSDTSVGGWLDASRYAGSMALLSGEIGTYAGVRFVTSSNAFKVLANQGPVIAGAAAGIVAVTDTYTSTAAHGLVTGNRVKLVSVSGGAGLTAGTTYYVIVTGTTTYKFATTLALAKAGTAIDVTTDSSAQVQNMIGDVHSTVIYGPNFFAIGDWGNNETFVTPPGGHDDPGHQSALMTWKGWLDAMVIGEGSIIAGVVSPPRYIRIESSAALV